MKTIALGLDGASFKLIDPWIKSGNLPNLNKIRNKGVWSDLESCLPPVSSPNWKCYSTGKNPGKLGIFWWENVDFLGKRIYCPNYRSDSQEIWDYLNENGKKVGVINIPLSYPPKKVDGYISSGGPTAKEENFAYPAEWGERLKREGYRVHPKKSISDRQICLKMFDEIIELIQNRFKVAEDIMENGDVEFIHLTIFYINVLQHFLWGEEDLKKAWKIIDKEIGKLISITEERKWNLIIFSDHGSNKIKEIFNINAWLKGEKLLKTEEPPLGKALSRLGLGRNKIIQLSEKLGIKDFLRKLVPGDLINKIPSKGGELSREAKTKMIDWENSSAIGMGQGGLYVDPKTNKEEIIHNLEALKSPSTKKRPVRGVYRKEEIYKGKYLDKAPDLMIDQSPNIHISGGLGKNKIFKSAGKWKGENRKTGIFLAYGPSIRENIRLKEVSILDIAPTILHLFNLPIPSDIDGRVIGAIFAKESSPYEREVKIRKVKEEDKDKLRNRIDSLKKAGKI